MTCHDFYMALLCFFFVSRCGHSYSQFWVLWFVSSSMCLMGTVSPRERKKHFFKLSRNFEVSLIRLSMLINWLVNQITCRTELLIWCLIVSKLFLWHDWRTIDKNRHFLTIIITSRRMLVFLNISLPVHVKYSITRKLRIKI